MPLTADTRSLLEKINARLTARLIAYVVESEIPLSPADESHALTIEEPAETSERPVEPFEWSVTWLTDHPGLRADTANHFASIMAPRIARDVFELTWNSVTQNLLHSFPQSSRLSGLGQFEVPMYGKVEVRFQPAGLLAGEPLEVAGEEGIYGAAVRLSEPVFRETSSATVRSGVVSPSHIGIASRLLTERLPGVMSASISEIDRFGPEIMLHACSIASYLAAVVALANAIAISGEAKIPALGTFIRVTQVKDLVTFQASPVWLRLLAASAPAY